MHRLCLLSQHSHGGSLGPLCMSRCPFGIQCSSCFLQPCDSEVLLAFPSARVIRCKRGCDTKVTPLSPRMDFLQLTCVHGTAAHSLLVQVHGTEGRTEDGALLTAKCSALSPRASRAQGDLIPSRSLAHKPYTDCDLKRFSRQTWDIAHFWHIPRKLATHSLCYRKSQKKRIRVINLNWIILHDSSSWSLLNRILGSLEVFKGTNIQC